MNNTPSKDFYVYVLKFPNGTPFYVGKGKDDRWLAHEREANSRKPPELFHNPYKVRAIRKVKIDDKELIKEKAIENVTEPEAFQLEKELIKKYGLKREGGLLINLTYGGEGFAGYE